MVLIPIPKKYRFFHPKTGCMQRKPMRNINYSFDLDEGCNFTLDFLEIW